MSTLSAKLTRIDSSVNSIRETIESPDAVIEDVAEGVKTKINGLNATISEKDATITAKDTTIAEKDAEIESLNQTITEKTANEEALANELMKYYGKGIVYNVTEESEMTAITDAPEGSICLYSAGETLYVYNFVDSWELLGTIALPA